jgi:hypothetical protein
MKAPESQILKSCLDYLRIKGHLAYRINSGAIKTERGRFVRFNDTAGIPDIIGLNTAGRFIGIECKSVTGKLSRAQEIQKAEIIERGGLYVLARSIDDLIGAGL